MKKYFILIFISFILLSSIVLIGPKFDSYLEKKLIKEINNSIVKIIGKKDLKLYQTDPWGFLESNNKNINQNTLIGNGFFINNNGYILTNKHIASNINGEYIIITKDKKEFNSKVLYIDENSDFSILKIESTNYKKLSINQNNLFVGQTIYKITTNLNILEKSQILETNINLEKGLNNLIETSINLKSGDSGSPLFNNHHQVIGINTAKTNKLNKSYSTIINNQQINKILKKLD